MATVEQLRAALGYGNVPASRRVFAQSLVEYFDRHGRWSARQQFFADQIVEQSQAAVAPVAAAPCRAVARTMPAAGVATVLGWFSRVRSINPRARARVVFPRASVGAGLRLSAPSPTSRYSADNTIFVHHERDYAGRISDGVFVPAGMMGVRVSAGLGAVMADPLGATVSAGRATGTCCFCARALTDERSVSVGYGPICAGHFGLPWGGETVQIVPEALAEMSAHDDAAELIDVTTIGSSGRDVSPLNTMQDDVNRAVAQAVGLPESMIARRARMRRERLLASAGTGTVTMPARPDLPSYEDGGPDDEDRQFM